MLHYICIYIIWIVIQALPFLKEKEGYSFGNKWAETSVIPQSKLEEGNEKILPGFVSCMIYISHCWEKNFWFHRSGQGPQMILLWIPVWWLPFMQTEWKSYLSKSCFPCLGYFAFLCSLLLPFFVFSPMHIEWIFNWNIFFSHTVYTDQCPISLANPNLSCLPLPQISLQLLFRIGQASKKAQGNKNKIQKDKAIDFILTLYKATW